ncbi:phospholipid metabolism enzyme regulator [Pochonia chlamydosporia 170]|uniref:Phospholipid metabolism enzyme regulator n=1 Tax=Pochonia chlamydosporia 170 TaxID=1380566 RepID=A0A179F8L6_METCM|nr:phospholipid metabolism enzyme regulator [Pochonia chlamydosporia 170]OAQ61776.1 phospholipid metabolism enzyme regulator [Pochonia chlamydosporia 170]
MDKSSAAADGAVGTAQSSNKTNNTTGPNGPSLPPPNNSTTASQTSKQSSAANSAAQSPAASRDGSPSRQPRRATSSTRQTGNRSRKNSHQDMSPTRQLRQSSQDRGTPTRTLSSTTTPNLRPNSREPPLHAPTPQKPSAIPDLKDSPRWPVSPRLRSPPPQLGRPGATTPTRRTEQEAPAISIQRPSPSPQVSDSQISVLDSDTDESHAPSGVRTPARGLLETVQEVSHNNSPARPNDSALLDQVKEKLAAPDNHSDGALSDGGRTLKSKMSNATQQNGADSGTIKADSRRTSSVPPPPLVSRQSSALSTKQAKSKPETGSTQSMTVETETVSSIPQVALTTATKEGGNGTLKAKPSTETIRPKKEKKRTTRKQPAVNSGTASSKADNFEAKIASAVDEANTSDSEETFVYDSNPPDNTERTNRRFHSRTPSATSMASQADRQNLRSIYGVMEGASHGPVAKKSMKFVNTFNGNASDSLTPGDEDGKGSGRSAGGSARGTVRHHHHIGRWGRQPGNGHASLFDNESPFPNAAKSKFPSTANNHNSRNSSNPPSPRNFLSTRGHLNSKRSNMQMSSSYDLDETTGADDERTPLIGTLRSSRGGRRRGPHSLRQAESQTYTRRSSYLNRFAACLVLTMMLLLVITGAIGFMFATSQPMTGIEIVSIKNVVTSEQVLMFDLTVKAHNPNIVVVTIDHANLEIFAKSEYGGTDSDWWKYPDGPDDFHIQDDPANDPPTDPGAGDGDDTDSRPNILLGRVTEFDSPLTFEGSLFHQGTSSSTGEMQLPNPGNGTSGGSARWDRIYQNEFDLIVKGVVKYSLPLSAHIRSATVSGRTTVKPNSANDPSHKPNSTILGI